MTSKPKFKVGPKVVRLNVKFYQQGERLNEQYQRITRIAPWSGIDRGFELKFINGDRCHEKFAKALTGKELG